MYTRGEESSVCEYVKVRGKEMGEGGGVHKGGGK